MKVDPSAKAAELVKRFRNDRVNIANCTMALHSLMVLELLPSSKGLVTQINEIYKVCRKDSVSLDQMGLMYDMALNAIALTDDGFVTKSAEFIKGITEPWVNATSAIRKRELATIW